MKVRIFRDAKGNILGSSEIASEKGVSVSLQPEKGHTTEDVTVAEQDLQDLKTFYKKHEKVTK